jgi:hypothetical protein
MREEKVEIKVLKLERRKMSKKKDEQGEKKELKEDGKKDRR